MLQRCKQTNSTKNVNKFYAQTEDPPKSLPPIDVKRDPIPTSTLYQVKLELGRLWV